MQQLLSNDVWDTIAARSRRAARRQYAIAYVTDTRPLNLRRGDTLIVDASREAIQSGQTSAKLLLAAKRKKCNVLSLPSLHAKVSILGDVVVVGSANASPNSQKRLTEAALLTDDPATVSSAKAFVYALSQYAERLEIPDIIELCRLRVTKPSFVPKTKRPALTPQGRRTWVVGTHELKDGAYPLEQAAAEKGEAEAKRISGEDHAEVNIIRWTGNGPIRRLAEPGDALIELWCPLGSKRIDQVLAPVAVLHRQDHGGWTRIYTEIRRGRDLSLSWAEFQTLARNCGLSRLGRGSERELTPEQADKLRAFWPR